MDAVLSLSDGLDRVQGLEGKKPLLEIRQEMITNHSLPYTKICIYTLTMTEGEHERKLINFYGTTKEIIQLDYNLDGRSVVLFKCDWFKLDGKKTELKNDGFSRSINVGSMWYKDDSLILATQARNVFYLPDTKYGTNWQVV